MVSLINPLNWALPHGEGSTIASVQNYLSTTGTYITTSSRSAYTRSSTWFRQKRAAIGNQNNPARIAAQQQRANSRRAARTWRRTAQRIEKALVGTDFTRMETKKNGSFTLDNEMELYVRNNSAAEAQAQYTQFRVSSIASEGAGRAPKVYQAWYMLPDRTPNAVALKVYSARDHHVQRYQKVLAEKNALGLLTRSLRANDPAPDIGLYAFPISYGGFSIETYWPDRPEPAADQEANIPAGHNENYTMGLHPAHVMEFCRGAHLSSILQNLASRNLKIPLKTVSCIIFRLLRFLQYMHDDASIREPVDRLNHNAISADSILYHPWMPDQYHHHEIKLINFSVTTTNRSASHVMLDHLKPPEAWGNPHDLPTDKSAPDIWCVGLLCIELISGYPLFYRNVRNTYTEPMLTDFATAREVIALHLGIPPEHLRNYEDRNQPPPTYEQNHWRLVQRLQEICHDRGLPQLRTNVVPSERAADFNLFLGFVARCLQYWPANRPNATELLEHPFVRIGQETDHFYYNPHVNGEEGGLYY